MKAFGAAFNNKPLPLHFLLGLDERVTPIDEVTIDGYTFFSACAQGKIDIALTFLLSGFDVNATEVNPHMPQAELRGLTGLHYAARSGDYALLTLLLNEGAVADAPSAGNGITPLMLALAGGHVETIKTLIAHGASPTRMDDHGDPAIFYGALQPCAMHVCKTMLNLNLATILSKDGQTALHGAARSKGSRQTLLYLCEMGGLDVNAVDSRGDTALHVAARVNDIDAIKALLGKGANTTIANHAGRTPSQQRETKFAKLIEKCARESNKSVLERMTLPDASNLANIDLKQIQHFAVAFTVPNILLWIGATLPSFIGMFLAFGSAFGFTLVAKFALSQKNRSLATAGWFSGALTFGSYVLVTRIFPIFAEDHPYGTEIVTLWWIFTTLMYISYARAVLADPGAVQSTPEKRRMIIEAVARDGEAAVKREHFDMTTYVKKPLRSKHCNKTHFTVCRFDHYCVWTGNAIAGGNHRPFVHYCIWQTLSQIIVSYTTFKTLFGFSVVRSKADLSGFFGHLDWMLNADNTLVTYFLVFYNSFVILFVSSVVLSQLWYASRNVTSNEVWFPDRYEWMFTLGSRAYSLYDQGPWKNLVDFFWTGNLCAENYVVPKMNDYLTTKTRQFAAQARSRQQAGGHQNNGVPTAITTGNEGGMNQDFSGGIPSTAVTDVASPLSPAEALTELQALLPADKQQEMTIMQEMVEQMIAGAAEPVVPASVTSESQRKDLVRRAKLMFRHLQQASGAVSRDV